jgi:tRNA pseudouridine55 synthase
LEALILNPGSAPLSRSIEDYPEGIIIPIDKPYRWTSADVIRKVKYAAIRHFGKKNLKVGHAGTLDPLATGVLLVCIGKATKLAETLQSHDKEYIAGVTFGATTPSYDLEKEIDRFFPHDHITSEGIQAALPGFIGEQDQVAPLFSAKSVDGVRAYELARKLYKETGKNPADDLQSAGKGGTESNVPDNKSASEFDTAAESLLRVSRINISELELLSFDDGSPASDAPKGSAHDAHENGTFSASEGELSTDCEDRATQGDSQNASSRINVTDNSALGLPRASIRMACSKGTYVRAFARDLGEALGTGAHLDSLQRSRSGIFRVENALTVEQTIAMLQTPSPAM